MITQEKYKLNKYIPHQNKIILPDTVFTGVFSA